jgi:prolyl 3-hydroxylase /prolyl 3,4-dihydroxylase
MPSIITVSQDSYENDMNDLFRPLSEEVLSCIGQAFKNQEEVSLEDVKVYTQPFPHMIIRQVFKDTSLLHRARGELQKLLIHTRSSDLYRFTQTDALIPHSDDKKNVDDSTTSMITLSSHPTVTILTKALYSTTWVNRLRRISHLELDQRPIDLSGQCYQQHDYLLCHDDRLEGRRLAFILYLVDEDWREEDGGHLELFSIDGDGQPLEVSRRILPVFNSFVFFEVTPISYHQVAEILSTDRQRISLSGWLHGPSSKSALVDVQHHEQGYQRSERLFRESIRAIPSSLTCSLMDLLHPSYRTGSSDAVSTTFHQIRRVFEQQSCVQLEHWINGDWLDGLRRDLRAARWRHLGPANRRHYEGYVEDGDRVYGNAFPCLTQIRRLWTSKEFLEWLNFVTGLSWKPLTSELRRFQSGDYTLLADRHKNDYSERSTSIDSDRESSGVGHLLDVLFFVGSESDDCLDQSQVPLADPSLTATTMKIDTGVPLESPWIYVSEKDPLLTIQPKSNALVLVYREEDIDSFQKYISHSMANRSMRIYRFDFISSYSETNTTWSDLFP